MPRARIETQSGTQTYLTLENESLRAELFLPKGAEMISLVHRTSGVQLMRQVEGYRDAYERILTTDEPYDDNFMNEYTTGGWFEMFPHAGQGVGGNPDTAEFHGDARTHRWRASIVKDDGRETVV